MLEGIFEGGLMEFMTKTHEYSMFGVGLLMGASFWFGQISVRKRRRR